MQDTLIDQGISLMIYGMGTVFVFLTILVFATGLMSKLVIKFAPPPVTVQPTVTPAATSMASPSGMTGPTRGEQPRPQVLEAIKQAISLHRQT